MYSVTICFVSPRSTPNSSYREEYRCYLVFGEEKLRSLEFESLSLSGGQESIDHRLLKPNLQLAQQ